MTDLVEVLIEDSRWNEVEISKLSEIACRKSLEHLKLNAANFEIELLACDNERIAGLNQSFRDKSVPTNVLSWPEVDLSAEQDGDVPGLPTPEMDDQGMVSLGNIAISYDTCMKEAGEQGLVPTDHILHLLVHGCLHLLGYDHVFEKDAALMEGLEVDILAKLGVKDPYYK